MAKNITRRQAAKTTAIGTGDAIIAPAALADPNPDARLVALEADWQKAEMDALAAYEVETYDEKTAYAALDRQALIEAEIAATPANSPVGIGVKLRIFHWYMQEHVYSDTCNSGALLHSIRRDLGETFYQCPSFTPPITED